MNWSRKSCFMLAGALFGVFFCIYYWPVAANFITLFIGALSPLFLGGMMAYVLNILMSFFEKHLFRKKANEAIASWKRIVSVIISIVCMVLIVSAVSYMVLPELWSCIQMLVKEVPGAVDNLVKQIQELAEANNIQLDSYLTDIDWKGLAEKAAAWVSNAVGGVMGGVTTALSSMVSLLVSFIFALYLLLGKDSLQAQFRLLMKHYVPGKWAEKISYVLKIMNNCFHKFIVGQCTEAVILGSLCAVGMMIFRFPYATMVGAVIACTALIPVAGAYIGAGVGAILILTVSPLKALLFVLYLVVLQQLEGNLIYPRVVGASIGLPGLWVLAAITVGGAVAGIGGMLFAVPLAATGYTIVRNDIRAREAALVPTEEENDEEDDIHSND